MALRKVKTFTSESRGRKAIVYRDSEWQEYRVKHFQDGIHQKDADYHDSDRNAAECHARAWAWHLPLK